MANKKAEEVRVENKLQAHLDSYFSKVKSKVKSKSIVVPKGKPSDPEEAEATTKAAAKK
jgi:hypothetical protein